jgi:hypothetical protein
MAELERLPSRETQCRLSWSTLSGTATFIDPDGRHNHVLRRHIHRSLFDTAVRWLSNCLPDTLRKPIQAFLPGPFLPPTAIIKELKPGWETEFDDEKRIYRKLAPLQGRVIPVLYGEGTTSDGTRALVLADIGDVSLHAKQAKHLSKQTLKGMIKPAVRAMLELGVEPADQNPRNYHLVGDAVFVLDFEDTAEVDGAKLEELADAVADGVAHWTVFYHQHNNG